MTDAGDPLFGPTHQEYRRGNTHTDRLGDAEGRWRIDDGQLPLCVILAHLARERGRELHEARCIRSGHAPRRVKRQSSPGRGAQGERDRDTRLGLAFALTTNLLHFGRAIDR